MRLLILSIILSLGLFSLGCGGNPRSDRCDYIDELCDFYPKDYYRCWWVDDFGVYRYWYEIWDSGDWRVWYNYDAMYNYYCD
jgi:hypothetical protein